ncbi:MAG: HNH endonuclease [Candidatus Baltobacteraceae bacterium]
MQRFHDGGHSFVECRREFGFTHTAWVKAIKRGQLVARFRAAGSGPVFAEDRRRIYKWSDIQKYYDEGHSYRDCREKFGFAAQSWQKARKRGEIVTRKYGMSIEKLLSGRRSRNHVKSRLLREGLLENMCSECGIQDWLGRALSLHIDHINGIGDDHRLENLRMLCPNCHSQTPTYGGRNTRRKALARIGPSELV